MNKYVREKTLLAIFIIGCAIALNIEIGIIFYKWLGLHLILWSVWCLFSIAFIAWAVITAEEDIGE